MAIPRLVAASIQECGSCGKGPLTAGFILEDAERNNPAFCQVCAGLTMQAGLQVVDEVDAATEQQT